MVDFSDVVSVVRALKEAQDFECDVRDRAREAIRFVEEPGGQWEDSVQQLFADKPRLELDKVTSIVDTIHEGVHEHEYGIKVYCDDDYQDEKKAKRKKEFVAGKIREIQSRSNTEDIYKNASMDLIKGGLCGWELTTDYINQDGFEQDIIIEPVFGFLDRVWFDPNAFEQDKSDAKYAFKISVMSKEDFEKEFPGETPHNVGQNLDYVRSYMTNKDEVTVGQIYYLKEKKETLYLLRGQSGEITQEMSTKDLKAYEAAGYEVINQRKYIRKQCYSRLFSATGWLTKEEETVWSGIPIVPAYANYNIISNNIFYRGAVQKLMDAQRAYNYAKSEELSQVALSNKPKYALTATQIAGFENEWGSANTNTVPYLLYNPDPEAPPPVLMNPNTVNPSLFQLSQSMADSLHQSAGKFAASMGDAQFANQSGKAIDILQGASESSNNPYSQALRVAIKRTFELILDALPKVIDTERMVKIIGEDGAEEEYRVNNPMDQEAIDLTNLKVSVNCKLGKSYTSRQQETADSIVEMSKVNPMYMQIGGDILARNINAPGFDDIAERLRVQLIQQGLIPPSQYTDEEKQQLAEAQAMAAQNPKPDPAMLMAQAEMAKGQAELTKAQNEQAKIQLQAQGKSVDAQLKAQKQQSDEQIAILKLQFDRLKEEYKMRETQFKAQIDAGKLSLDQQQAEADILNTQANTLKVLADALQLGASQSTFNVLE